MTNTEGGTDREEFRTAAVKDRAITTAQASRAKAEPLGITQTTADKRSRETRQNGAPWLIKEYRSKI